MGSRTAAGERAASCLDAWLPSLRSENTRDAYRADVAHFINWCVTAGVDPLSFSVGQLGRYRDALRAAGASSATEARRLSAIASFGTYAQATGASGPFPDVIRPEAPRSSSAIVLDDNDATALLAAADLLAPRSSVLIRLLMLDGLKVSEAAAADASALSGRPPRTLQLASRTIRLHQQTAAAIQAYLGRRRDGPLLLSEQRGRSTERLTRFGIDYLVKEAAQEADLPSAVSGNVLRRRYVLAEHARGTAIDEIQRTTGHADERTTRRYLPTDAPDR
jgi:site-specific recombinase XerD